MQILSDNYGNVVHLGERDCSLQRRHQKVLEEAPSAALTPEQRAEIGKIACDAIAKLGYRNAGTIEFLYEGGQFYFIEMNTRLQVEHPVTEAITGIDLVREQIRIAAGEKLGYTQEDVKFTGHAMECRVNAEDPVTFTPCPGTVVGYHPPGGLGVRVDSGLYAGYRIPPTYDSMIAKLIVHGNNREQAIMRLRRAISEFVIDGVKTTLPLHNRLVHEADFINGDYDIHWLEEFVGR
jgi:acetyl-CoA carboxylase biotin carboxylase subunit